MASCGWCWAILWFFVLILFAIPVAFIVAVFYIILLPFAACCTCAKQATDFLLKGVQLPYTVASYMVAGKACG